MNATKISSSWLEQKSRLKQKFAELTDNDLLFDEGKKEEMLGKLQKRLGKTKAEMATIWAAL